jgi:hypothetical protein
MEVMTIVNAFDIGMLSDKVDIFSCNMRAIHKGKIDPLLVCLNPIQDPAIPEFISVQHLHPHLQQRGGVGLLMVEIIPDEFYGISMIQEHPDKLEGTAGTGVLVIGRHIVIDHQYGLFAIVPLPGREEAGGLAVIGLKRKLFCPLLLQLFEIFYLIFLQTAV